MGREESAFTTLLITATVAASISVSILLVADFWRERRNGADRKNECAKKFKIIQPVPQSGKSKQPTTGASVKAVCVPISQGRLLEK